MRGSALLLALLAVTPALAGCTDLFGGMRPDYPVARTAVVTGPGAWNTDGQFTVQVNQAEPLEVVIEAKPVPDGLPISKSGFSDLDTPVTLDIPDGTWIITYSVDGHKWETFRQARFDATPPEIAGLETIGEAPQGSYLLGAGALAEDHATIEVIQQSTGIQVSAMLPVQLSGLSDGVHAYDVVAADQAGNEAVYTVQVVVGAATQLPAGGKTMGVVARYTVTAALWDIRDLGSFLPIAGPGSAQSRMPGHLGSGEGITPDDPAVQEVVDEVVQPGMTTAEAAMALYQWMFDHLEYDEVRLDQDDLLDPAQTIQAGGGVCRDLAALYVSLLRAAGVPSRLVAGYLGGRVGGFHAWVEFYGGDGHGPSPWVPVDVSGIDEAYSDVAMLQAFGIRLPEYLMLRALTPDQEQDSWSSAATLSYSTPPRAAKPDAPFNETVSNVVDPTRGALCVHLGTRFREFGREADGDDCKTPAHIPNFVTKSVRVLDYGIRVVSAARGTTLSLEVVYPDVADTSADRVEFSFYAPTESDGCTPDPATGRATCRMDLQ